MDDFKKLDPLKHQFELLIDDPYSFIRSQVENILQKQVADAQLKSFQVTSEPQWLIGGGKEQKKIFKRNLVLVVRAGVAFEFSLIVETANETESVAGVFSLVGVRLDNLALRKLRCWLDIDGTLETFGSNQSNGLEDGLFSRLYLTEIDE